MTKMLFLGQSPSILALNKGYKTAFEGSPSGAKLFSWIIDAGVPIEICDFANAIPEPLKPGQKPTVKMVSDAYITQLKNRYFKSAIIAVGDFAWKSLKRNKHNVNGWMAKIDHPSGLNRNLNNSNKSKECIEVIREVYRLMNYV